jgi:dCTP deaminase
MGILSSDEILDRLKLDIGNPKSLVVTPLLLKKEALSTDSIDLRLGSYFLLPQVPPRPFIALDEKTMQGANLRVHVPFGKYLVVPAHHTVLGATLEFIKLPADISGQILTKSSIARTFVVIETAPWVHPSYRGCLTLEIANVSNTPLLIHPGLKIGQLILQTVNLPEAPKADQKLTGSYLGPVYPESPKFGSVHEQLELIGIKDVALPKI